jgi:glycosyltransferase involved in cell wall biosynthesis
MPAALRSIAVEDADVVITSSSGWAHAIRVPEGVPHVCYCHTPAHWLYDTARYLERGQAAALAPLLTALRRWDRKAAERPPHYLANTRNGRERNARIDGRTASVLHPPVEVDRFTPSPIPGDGYLLALCRLLRYKRVDLVIEAGRRLGVPVLVVGDGPDRARLEGLAGSGVTFAGRVPDSALAGLYAGARAYVMAGEEDFGIAALEANAAGRPVVAFGRGGALETILDGETGVLFRQQTGPAVAEAAEAALARDWDPAAMAAHAARFAPDVFLDGLERIVAEHADAHRGG